MAIRKLNDPTLVAGWTNKLPFPKDRYAARCIEEDFNVSKNSGNPLITRTWELVHSEPVQIGEKNVDIDGLKITQFVVTKVKDGDSWDAEKSDKAFSRFRDDLIAMGFDPDGEIDDENPPCFMKGKIADIIVYAQAEPARRSPTPEQMRKGQKVGDPIKDNNGKDVITYKLAIESILGPSTVECNRPW